MPCTAPPMPLPCTEVRPEDPCIWIRFRLVDAVGAAEKERGMHLDRKSDTGHKKCTAHGSRDAKSEADEAERERHTRKRFIERQRQMYIERQRQMQRKQRIPRQRQVTSKQGVIQCKKIPRLEMKWWRFSTKRILSTLAIVCKGIKLLTKVWLCQAIATFTYIQYNDHNDEDGMNVLAAGMT